MRLQAALFAALAVIGINGISIRPQIYSIVEQQNQLRCERLAARDRRRQEQDVLAAQEQQITESSDDFDSGEYYEYLEPVDQIETPLPPTRCDFFRRSCNSVIASSARALLTLLGHEFPNENVAENSETCC